MEPIDVPKLVDEFAQAVADQTDAVWRGEHREGNKHAKRYLAAFQKLRAIGDAGRDALVPLLNHERMDVRVMAATFLLRHRTTESMSVLRQAAKGPGLVAFEAAEAIKRWNEGAWALDPAD
jgi:Domain of unknown function (DUF2019)